MNTLGSYAAHDHRANVNQAKKACIRIPAPLSGTALRGHGIGHVLCHSFRIHIAASQTAFLKAELGRRFKTVASHIERLDAEIEGRIDAEPALKRRYDILITIPGVGPVAAVALVVGLPELGACSAKAASLLAGLAPLACDSGEKAGERHIKGGRAFVRTGIYLAALAAARFNPQLSDDYKRLRGAGKKVNLEVVSNTDAQAKLDALEQKEQERRLPPVMVIREADQPVIVPVRFDRAETGLAWRVVLENGTTINGNAERKGLEPTPGPNLQGRSLIIEHHLPLGYHRLEVDEWGAVMPLIIVPPGCWMPQMLQEDAKVWGIAAQLYLLRTESNWVSATLATSSSLSNWGRDGGPISSDSIRSTLRFWTIPAN